mgnify:CR=1 FL=1
MEEIGDGDADRRWRPRLDNGWIGRFDGRDSIAVIAAATRDALAKCVAHSGSNAAAEERGKNDWIFFQTKRWHKRSAATERNVSSLALSSRNRQVATNPAPTAWTRGQKSEKGQRPERTKIPE